MQDSVGELLKKVSENEDAAVVAKFQVQADMPVSEHAVVILGVFFCPLYQFFVLLALVWTRAADFFESASSCPLIAEGIAQGWRQQAEEELWYRVVKKSAQPHETAYLDLQFSRQALHEVARHDAIAVCHEDAFAVKGERFGLPVHANAGVAGKVAKGPDVVIANEEMYFYSPVSQCSECLHERQIELFRARHVPCSVGMKPPMGFEQIFVPKVKNVTQQEDVRGIRAHLSQQPAETVHMPFGVGYDP